MVVHDDAGTTSCFVTGTGHCLDFGTSPICRPRLASARIAVPGASPRGTSTRLAPQHLHLPCKRHRRSPSPVAVFAGCFRKFLRPPSGPLCLIAGGLHPSPFTLHRSPFTLHPSPFTLHPSPFTLGAVLPCVLSQVACSGPFLNAFGSSLALRAKINESYVANVTCSPAAAPAAAPAGSAAVQQGTSARLALELPSLNTDAGGALANAVSSSADGNESNYHDDGTQLAASLSEHSRRQRQRSLQQDQSQSPSQSPAQPTCSGPALSLVVQLRVPSDDAHNETYYSTLLSDTLAAWSSESPPAPPSDSMPSPPSSNSSTDPTAAAPAAAAPPLRLCALSDASGDRILTSTEAQVVYQLPLTSQGVAVYTEVR